MSDSEYHAQRDEGDIVKTAHYMGNQTRGIPAGIEAHMPLNLVYACYAPRKHKLEIRTGRGLHAGKNSILFGEFNTTVGQEKLLKAAKHKYNAIDASRYAAFDQSLTQDLSQWMSPFDRVPPLMFNIENELLDTEWHIGCRAFTFPDMTPREASQLDAKLAGWLERYGPTLDRDINTDDVYGAVQNLALLYRSPKDAYKGKDSSEGKGASKGKNASKDKGKLQDDGSHASHVSQSQDINVDELVFASLRLPQYQKAHRLLFAPHPEHVAKQYARMNAELYARTAEHEFLPIDFSAPILVPADLQCVDILKATPDIIPDRLGAFDEQRSKASARFVDVEGMIKQAGTTRNHWLKPLPKKQGAEEPNWKGLMRANRPSTLFRRRTLAMPDFALDKRGTSLELTQPLFRENQSSAIGKSAFASAAQKEAGEREAAESSKQHGKHGSISSAKSTELGAPVAPRPSTEADFATQVPCSGSGQKRASEAKQGRLQSRHSKHTLTSLSKPSVSESSAQVYIKIDSEEEVEDEALKRPRTGLSPTPAGDRPSTAVLQRDQFLIVSPPRRQMVAKHLWTRPTPSEWLFACAKSRRSTTKLF